MQVGLKHKTNQHGYESGPSRIHIILPGPDQQKKIIKLQNEGKIYFDKSVPVPVVNKNSASDRRHDLELNLAQR